LNKLSRRNVGALSRRSSSRSDLEIWLGHQTLLIGWCASLSHLPHSISHCLEVAAESQGRQIRLSKLSPACERVACLQRRQRLDRDSCFRAKERILSTTQHSNLSLDPPSSLNARLFTSPSATLAWSWPFQYTGVSVRSIAAHSQPSRLCGRLDDARHPAQRAGSHLSFAWKPNHPNTKYWSSARHTQWVHRISAIRLDQPTRLSASV
jgi:hypothetical protein